MRLSELAESAALDREARKAETALLTPEYFSALGAALYADLAANEALTLSLTAEESQFIRFNRAKIRQIGNVRDQSISLQFVAKEDPSGALRSSQLSMTLTGDLAHDQSTLKEALAGIRRDTATLPVDPYAILPTSTETSNEIHAGRLLSIEESATTILGLTADLDFVGIYAAGTQIRANSNSLGQNHWFSTESFSLDYSLYTPSEKAVKAIYGGREWSSDVLEAQLSEGREQLRALERPVKKLNPGQYRVFFAPSAVHELLGILSWNFIGEQSIRNGQSSVVKIKSGERNLSPLFSLREDFSSGAIPRFNDLGEVAPEMLTLFEQGVIKNSLVSTRTALEYKISGNQADEEETLRSPVLLGGSLKSREILSRLGTGLYVSNLHYLNWSDAQEARVTGMTRYACFWVEDGKLVAPIDNMRFDDTLFRIFGSELEDLTQTLMTFPDTSSYFWRALGTARAPGILVKNFNFVL